MPRARSLGPRSSWTSTPATRTTTRLLPWTTKDTFGSSRRRMVCLGRRTSIAANGPTTSTSFKRSTPAMAKAIDRSRSKTFPTLKWRTSQGGFACFFTHYRDPAERTSFFMTSPDGVKWSQWLRLAAIEQGHYQVSTVGHGKMATAMDYHPQGKGLNWRTNLYYLESADGGKTWRTAAGTVARLAALDGRQSGPGARLSIRGPAGLCQGGAVRRRRAARHRVPHQSRPRVRPGERSAHLVDRALDRYEVGIQASHDFGPQLRRRIAVPGSRRHVAR